MDGLHNLFVFFEAIKADHRISITHIGVFAALVQYQMQNEFANPIYVFSREIMTIAKLSSAITYHKCIRELSEYGYIRYEPSFNRLKGSRIYFFETVIKRTIQYRK